MDCFAICPDILEVTLRDGSYLIDFQFTAADTSTIASALESVGFRWIEVGHGLGLNASASGKGVAAATDEGYLEAAAEALSSARWGMFFIPGLGRPEDLRLAARYKMDFVRIGTNVTELSQAEPFIKQAKDLGMLVSYNGMKSYAVSPEAWGRCAAQAHQWGADIVCLVDSAGSMYPEEVSSYLRAAKSQSPVRLGFHGHDNLSLSMANTLRAIDEGAALVDTSLQGMGRSAGNAITEVLVAILRKRGLLPGIEMKAVMDVGSGLIRPLLGRRGVDPMAVTGGVASFHSSFAPKVVKYAQKHGIDVRDLIVSLCQQDQISAPDDLLERLSLELAEAKMSRTLSIPAFGIRGQERSAGREALLALLKELRPQSVKAGKFSALNVVIGEKPQEEIGVSGNIQQTIAHVAGSVSYSNEEQLQTILEMAEGAVDVLMLDVDRKSFGPSTPATTAARMLRTTLLLTYLDSRIWASAVEDQAVRLLADNLEGANIVIAGDHPKSRLLAVNLMERRACVTVLTMGAAPPPPSALLSLSFSPDACGIEWLEDGSAKALDRLTTARLLVLWPGRTAWFGKTEASLLSPGTCVLEAGTGALLPEGRAEAQQRQALLVKVNMWPALAGALLSAHESQRICRDSMGWGELAGVPVVSGGALGKKGDVIVDSVRDPSRLIGVSDGEGGIVYQYSDEDATRVSRVAQAINSRIVMPHLTTV